MHQQILLNVEVLLGFCKQDPNGTPATSVLAKVLATRISQWHIEPEHIQNIYYDYLCENDATITLPPRTDWFVCNTPWISPQRHKCIFQKRLRLQHLRVLGCHSTKKGRELQNWAGSSSVRLFGDKPKRADEPERKFPYRPAKRKQIACGRSQSGKGLLSRSDVSCCILKHFAQKREVSLLPMGKVNFQIIWDMGTVMESWSISQSAEFGGRRYCFLSKMVMFPRTIKTVWRKSIPFHNTTALGDSMRFPQTSVSFLWNAVQRIACGWLSTQKILVQVVTEQDVSVSKGKLHS